MPLPSRHLLLFCALLALTGFGGAAYANGPGGNPGSHGDGGDHGNSPGDHGGDGGDQGSGPDGGPPGGPGDHNSDPGQGGNGGVDPDQGQPGDHNPFHNNPHPPPPPPMDGDNDAGDDPPPVADPTLSPGTPMQSDDNANSRRRRGIQAARFVRAPVLDQEQSRQAIQNGKAASMPLLLAYLNLKYPGQLLDVKLHDTNEGLVYEVRYLANIIELHTLFLDAMTLGQK